MPNLRSDARDVLRIQQAHGLETGFHLAVVVLAEIIEMGGSGGDE